VTEPDRAKVFELAIKLYMVTSMGISPHLLPVTENETGPPPRNSGCDPSIGAEMAAGERKATPRIAAELAAPGLGENGQAEARALYGEPTPVEWLDDASRPIPRPILLDHQARVRETTPREPVVCAETAEARGRSKRLVGLSAFRAASSSHRRARGAELQGGNPFPAR
jgi:hypothetical protein